MTVITSPCLTVLEADTVKKVLNMGGETLTFECDDSDDDDESLLLPVRKPIAVVQDSGDDTDVDGTCRR